MNHWDRKEYIGHAGDLDSADDRLARYKQEYDEFGDALIAELDRTSEPE